MDGDYRVSDIMVAGKPLDLNQTYTVAAHNYMLKYGGDGMSMVKGSKVIQEDMDVDLFSSYIQDHLKGTVGADHVSSQGRIIIK